MPKADLIRRIDHKPARSESGLNVFPSQTGPGGTTDHRGPYCVGRVEGPRICITDQIGRGSEKRPGVEFYVRETANEPFVSFGELDWPTNTKWIQIGYAEKKGIRFAPHTLALGDVEEHLDLAIDAETLVGTIPCAVWDATAAACGGGSGACSDATGTVEAVDAYLIIVNGCIVDIVWKGGIKSATRASTMVLGALMGAVYAGSVYEDATAYMAK